MLANLRSCSLFGIDAFPVDVEVDVSRGCLPSYQVVGLPTASVREGGARIQSALKSIGHPLPAQRITVNLAPGDRRKDGAAFDLPIALAILCARQVVDPTVFTNALILGELGLDGRIRQVRGGLAAALLAKKLGLTKLLAPRQTAIEAAAVESIDVFALDHLCDALDFATGKSSMVLLNANHLQQTESSTIDLSEVKGQPLARAALEVAVAGGHNILFAGPPGIGKTMLAKRIPTILPPLTRDESLETTRIHSAAGLAPSGLLTQRPFRAPHHSISTPALIGGGSPPHPGELSLAHHGVLFLDELPEFTRSTLESLRQPLEDRFVSIGRATGNIRVPASVLVAASANPCPCGWHGSRERECTCTGQKVERYRSRLSGPLLDRMDLQIFVPNVSLTDLRNNEHVESSTTIRERVILARERQSYRLRGHVSNTNAEMSTQAVKATCPLNDKAESMLSRLHAKNKGMTGRGVQRLIKMARTIADLASETQISSNSLIEAYSYRFFDRDPIHNFREKMNFG